MEREYIYALDSVQLTVHLFLLYYCYIIVKLVYNLYIIFHNCFLIRYNKNLNSINLFHMSSF